MEYLIVVATAIQAISACVTLIRGTIASLLTLINLYMALAQDRVRVNRFTMVIKTLLANWTYQW